MKIKTQVEAGGISINHNQTLVRIVEGFTINHNQTLVNANPGKRVNRKQVRKAS
ncbi:MAG: hypothetical protein QOH06_3088 [Acidobacteriota bacterium]|jgi:hypothetical protein|nr:hypothetical protein [Acidobacteriota bacterium]